MLLQHLDSNDGIVGACNIARAHELAQKLLSTNLIGLFPNQWYVANYDPRTIVPIVLHLQQRVEDFLTPLPPAVVMPRQADIQTVPMSELQPHDWIGMTWHQKQNVNDQMMVSFSKEPLPNVEDTDLGRTRQEARELQDALAALIVFLNYPGITGQLYKLRNSAYDPTLLQAQAQAEADAQQDQIQDQTPTEEEKLPEDPQIPSESTAPVESTASTEPQAEPEAQPSNPVANGDGPVQEAEPAQEPTPEPLPVIEEPLAGETEPAQESAPEQNS